MIYVTKIQVGRPSMNVSRLSVIFALLFVILCVLCYVLYCTVSLSWNIFLSVALLVTRIISFHRLNYGKDSAAALWIGKSV